MKNEKQIDELLVYLLAAGKGGAGKSTLTFLLAEKFKDAFVLDSDDATKSTTFQLAYRAPYGNSFLDSAGRIDRNAFNNMFESIANVKRGVFISDTGAAVSDQLPFYLETNGGELIAELLHGFNIRLRIICIVCGKNDFRTSMEYLEKLNNSTGGFIEVTAAHNRHFEMSDDQKNQFEDFCAANNIRTFSFDLLSDKSEISLRIASDVLKAGKGLSGLDPFKAIYFKKALQEIPDFL